MEGVVRGGTVRARTGEAGEVRGAVRLGEAGRDGGDETGRDKARLKARLKIRVRIKEHRGCVQTQSPGVLSHPLSSHPNTNAIPKLVRVVSPEVVQTQAVTVAPL